MRSREIHTNNRTGMSPVESSVSSLAGGFFERAQREVEKELLELSDVQLISRANEVLVTLSPETRQQIIDALMANSIMPSMKIPTQI